MVKWLLYSIISPSRRDLDYILIVATMQSRDTITIPFKIIYLM